MCCYSQLTLADAASNINVTSRNSSFLETIRPLSHPTPNHRHSSRSSQPISQETTRCIPLLQQHLFLGRRLRFRRTTNRRSFHPHPRRIVLRLRPPPFFWPTLPLLPTTTTKQHARHLRRLASPNPHHRLRRRLHVLPPLLLTRLPPLRRPAKAAQRALPPVGDLHVPRRPNVARFQPAAPDTALARPVVDPALVAGVEGVGGCGG